VDGSAAALTVRGERTFYQLADDAVRYLAQAPTSDLYAHVIVDEAQDLHPVQWRLLRAAVPDGPNDLFLVGDAHQRIYDHRVSLSSMGIDVRGRSFRLMLNYRTTEEILRWCIGLLRGTRVDDLDAGTESMAGYRSAFHGSAPPLLAGHANGGEEMTKLARVVRGWIDAGFAPSTIGVAARFRKTAQAALGALRDSGIPVHDLERAGSGGVEVGTMHRMKGLEYRAVAVIDVSAASIPARWNVTPETDDPKAYEQDLLRERCLLYVACTRARELLYVSWSGRPSPFIAHLTADT
jgi:superfamily I DNA/RNA helicase